MKPEDKPLPTIKERLKTPLQKLFDRASKVGINKPSENDFDGYDYEGMREKVEELQRWVSSTPIE